MRIVIPVVAVLASTPLFGATPTPADTAPVAAPALQVGDSWVYDRTHEQGTANFASRRVDLKIDRIGDDNMLVGIKQDGAPTDFQDHITGLDWSQRRMVDGKETVTGRPFRFPMTIGAKWTADYDEPMQRGVQTHAHFHSTYKVIGWEDVTVPAGTFHALKIQMDGMADVQVSIPATAGGVVSAGPQGATTVTHAQPARSGVVHIITYGEFYYAPAVKYYVKSVDEQYNAENVRTVRDTQQLVSFKAGA